MSEPRSGCNLTDWYRKDHVVPSSCLFVARGASCEEGREKQGGCSGIGALTHARIGDSDLQRGSEACPREELEGRLVFKGHRRDIERPSSEKESWWVSLVGYRLTCTEKPYRCHNQHTTANGGCYSSG
jgi:hypothetical protein